MATWTSFEDMEIWQRARILAQKVYQITNRECMQYDFRMKDQMRGSAGSIMDNVAEGFERGSRKKFIQFLAYSKGSVGELRSQLYRAYDQNYISPEELKEHLRESKKIGRMIGSQIAYLKRTNHPGSRFT